jgi:hypothetical protein
MNCDGLYAKHSIDRQRTLELLSCTLTTSITTMNDATFYRSSFMSLAIQRDYDDGTLPGESGAISDESLTQVLHSTVSRLFLAQLTGAISQQAELGSNEKRLSEQAKVMVTSIVGRTKNSIVTNLLPTVSPVRFST